MAEQEIATDDKFVEIEGVKYKEDPDNEGDPLVDDETGENVLFEEKEEEEKDDDKEPEIADPKPRRSAADHILARKEKKEKKEKKEEVEEKGDEEGKKEENQQDVQTAVEEGLAPIKSQIKKTSDEQELRDVLNDKDQYPHAKKLEAGIRKYMDHPAYQDASIEMIYHALVSKTGLVAKAIAKAEADKETEETNLGGGATRRKKDTKMPDFSKMTDEEFNKWDKEQNR